MNRLKFVIALLLILLMSANSEAAGKNWEALKFTEDISAGLSELETYCKTHKFEANDIFWANQIESSDITAGTTLYLPANHGDMLSIWQQTGRANMPKPKTTAMKVTQPVTKTEPVSAEVKPSQAAKPAEPVKTPAQKVIAETAKPDKILTAKKKSADIPGLMDPVIIFSPNGDSASGPMRLIISGDKVEVVKLPPSAAPKKPSAKDINNSFTTDTSYLTYYQSPLRRRNNNNVFTNLNIANGKMMWPVDGKVSSYFGWRGKRMHEGIDIPMPAGTPIRAARNGIVIRTGNNATMGFRGYGNFVMIDHGGSLKTFYAHCSSVCVVQGQRVMQGQIIGYVGNTGRSTANHLHFEVRVNDSKVNPIPYLAGRTQLANK